MQLHHIESITKDLSNMLEEKITWSDLKIKANGNALEIPTVYVYSFGKFKDVYLDYSRIRYKSEQPC